MQSRVLLVAVGRPGRARDVIALAKTELADLLDRDVRVVLRRPEAVDPQETVAVIAQIEEPVDGHRLPVPRLVVAFAVLSTAAAPVPPIAALGLLVGPPPLLTPVRRGLLGVAIAVALCR